MAKRWLEFFRSGCHTDRRGFSREYPTQELKDAIASYDPTQYKAPLIISHETKGVADFAVSEQPFCFGFPTELKLVGDRLKAGFEKIAPEFLEWVQNGNLIAVSPSFYLPDDSRNPTPGKLHLRHIAALGKNPPAVKGLDGLESLLVEMGEATEGTVEFAFPAKEGSLFAPEFSMAEREMVSLFRRMREWLLESHGAEVADRVIPGLELDSLAEYATYESDEIRRIWDRIWALEPHNSEPEYNQQEELMPTKEELDAREAELAKKQKDLELQNTEFSEREKAIAAREAEIKAKEVELLRQQATEFAEGLDGLTAGDAPRVAELYYQISANQIPEFAEGDKSESALDVFKGVIRRLCETAPQPEFGEQAPADECTDSAPEFSAAPGYEVDPEKARLYAEAKALAMRKGITLSQAIATINK